MAAAPVVSAGSRGSDFLALTKPRLNLLVLITTLGGLYLAAPQGVPPLLLLHTVIGTALVAGGASALNQVWERTTDGLMRRTRGRPVPDGRLQAAEGTRFGLVLAAAGLAQLALGVNALAAAVAAVTLGSYVLSVKFARERSTAAARRLFFASIAYLPLLWAVLVANRLWF